MDLSLSDKVKDLRATIEKNKLVIFVGAGVSQNSGIPTRSELIEEFAKKIKYDKCKTCTHEKKGCKLKNCQDRCSFTQDEFLKIPQYFYSNDKSKGHKRYQKVIVDTLKSENKSNPLNDMIMTLLPKHIITTNSDKLLENSKNPNTMLYDVIIEDKDLLTHNSNNYIIKMHGDIDRPETIILKEDDYINYQQEHILIDTYIKSLLIDHTVLFVGYSLNDYNLKLILGWIQYLAKEHSVNGKRPNNYIIQVQDSPLHQKHLEKYFESHNIFILNTYDLPAEIKEKYHDVALPKLGKEVYALLNYIYDDKNDFLLDPLAEILYQKYRIFDTFKRISFEDLLSVYSFGQTENKGGNLYFYQSDEFKNLKLIVKSIEKKETYIKQILIKAGIFAIQCREELVTFKEENKTKQTINDELFTLYLNNDYLGIFTKLKDDIKDDILILYYIHLVLPQAENLIVKLDEIENSVRFRHKLDFIIYKYNRILFKLLNFQSTTEDFKEFENIISNLPKQYKKCYGFIEKLLNDMSKNRLKCLNLLSEHEIYLKRNNSIILGKRLGNLLELQSLAYDYYYYFKFNNIMLDYLSNPKTYFEPYIKAILCTFSPQKERHLNNERDIELYNQSYKLNSIDFDILIKFTNHKSLKAWVSEYKVKEITFEDDVNIVDKIINLCTSMITFGNKYNNVHLSNYLFITTKCKITNEDKGKIITALGKLIQPEGNKVNDILINIFEEIEYIINFYREETIIPLKNILYTLLHDETIKLINERFEMNLSIVFRNLQKYSDAHVSEVIDMLICSQHTTLGKLNMIYTLRHLFSDTQKTKYMRIVKENISLIHSQYLYKYIVDRNLTLDETIKRRFIEIIEREVAAEIANPCVCKYPNWLVLTLDFCINLHLLKIWENIDCLRPFTIYSDSLSFILDSENFDYTKIDTGNYMWTNLFKNKHYRDILKSHKSEIIRHDLNRAIENGYATDDQKKILYKYLLSEDELWSL